MYQLQQQLSQSDSYRVTVEEKLAQSESYRATAEEKLRIIQEQKTTLEGKVSELKQDKELLDQHLKVVKQKGFPPVPKPRTTIQSQVVDRLESENRRLTEEKQKLEAEVAQARRQCESMEQARTVAENLLQEARKKTQDVGYEYLQLKVKLKAQESSSRFEEESRQALEESRQENHSLTERVVREVSEKNDLQRRIRELEVRCQSLEKEKDQLRALAADAAKEMAPSPAQKKGMPTTAVRLNTVMGEKMQLELVSSICIIVYGLHVPTLHISCN